MRAGYLLRIGDVLVNVTVDRGRLDVGEGPAADPDLEIESTPAAMHALLAGELSASEAVRTKAIRTTGDPGLLDSFTEMFSFDTLSPPAAGS